MKQCFQCAALIWRDAGWHRGLSRVLTKHTSSGRMRRDGGGCISRALKKVQKDGTGENRKWQFWELDDDWDHGLIHHLPNRPRKITCQPCLSMQLKPQMHPQGFYLFIYLNLQVIRSFSASALQRRGVLRPLLLPSFLPLRGEPKNSGRKRRRHSRTHLLKAADCVSPNTYRASSADVLPPEIKNDRRKTQLLLVVLFYWKI